ncbi:hypothetical protein C8Q80DRAFT_1120162 [Daedaleopsis nitida]|nr:hypothetical protein C8Q80DRAFT_1120162 [Daedaleopsis nitida]
MAPPPWTTPEQTEWLTQRKGEYLDAQKHSRLPTWLTALYHDWFIHWPEHNIHFPGIDPKKLTDQQKAVLADAIIKRHGQLRSWFRNHHSESRAARGIPASITAELKKGKPGRAPHAREVYCRLFYDEEKKNTVNQDLKAERVALGRKLTRAETMTITRRRVDAWYTDASEEIKNQVAAKLEEETQAKRVTTTPADVSSERTPEEYQQSISTAPGIIDRILEPVFNETGWCITIIAAGPSPVEGGDIKTFAVHLGRNTSGHTLDQAVPDFRERYIRPMIHFAKGVYPKEVRLKRAILNSAVNLRGASEPSPGPSAKPGREASQSGSAPVTSSATPEMLPNPSVSTGSPASSPSRSVSSQLADPSDALSMLAGTAVAQAAQLQPGTGYEHMGPGMPFTFSESSSFPTSWQSAPVSTPPGLGEWDIDMDDDDPLRAVRDAMFADMTPGDLFLPVLPTILPTPNAAADVATSGAAPATTAVGTIPDPLASIPFVPAAFAPAVESTVALAVPAVSVAPAVSMPAICNGPAVSVIPTVQDAPVFSSPAIMPAVSGASTAAPAVVPAVSVAPAVVPANAPADAQDDASACRRSHRQRRAPPRADASPPRSLAAPDDMAFELKARWLARYPSDSYM